MASRGRIRSLEIENFKSFGGKNVIAFRGFTSVVGPNGAGKSNLMDAVSFVLGIHSRHLRSSKLIELLHKGPGASRGSRRATVALTYERPSADPIVFSRTISPVGVGAPPRAYRLDGAEVTREAYEETLKGIGVLVKARNFLVFQGDVESLASKSSGELTALFEQISGSEDFKAEYDTLKAAKDAAEEASIVAFQSKKGLAAQRRAVKGQRDEADKYAGLDRELGRAKVDYFLWQIRHARDRMAETGAAVAAAGEDLAAAEAAEADAARRATERTRGAQAAQKALAAAEAKRAASRSALRGDVAPQATLEATRVAAANALRECRDALPGGRGAAKEAERAERVATLQRLFRGVLGRFVDVCRPAQRKYNVAVAVAAGKFNEAIVVETRQCAVDCIRYLRDARLGSALFLPLDGIDPPRADERLRSLGPGYHLAVDVVQCDAAVAKAVAYAVGATVVCDDLDGARRLCYGPDADGRPPVKAVTLKGAQIAKSGTITGGAYGSGAPGLSDRAPGKAWRASDAVALEAKATEAAAAARESRDARAEVEAKLPELQAAVAKLEATAKWAAKDADKAAAAKKEALAREKSLAGAAKPVAKDAKAAAARAAASRDAHARLRAAKRAVEDRVYAGFAEKHDVDVESLLGDAGGSAAAAARDDEAALARLRARAATLRAAYDYEASRDLAGRAAAVEDKLRDGRKKLKGLKKDAAKVEKAQSSAERGLGGLDGEVADARAAYEAAQAELGDLRAERSAAGADRAAARRAIDAGESALDKLRSSLAEIVRKAKVEHVLLPVRDAENEAPGSAPHATGVAEADAVDASRLDGDDDGDAGRHEDRQRARWARCEALQRELDALAPNMKAGDQFDDVSDKLRVADGALNRSRDAARDAAAAFERVKKDRRDAFLACFDVVSKALASFYADITKSLRHPNGGAASLHVLDADEPYLGGVSFHATPPSKRFCEISQLSGGERTLASLALLFAVHGYHPAPWTPSAAPAGDPTASLAGDPTVAPAAMAMGTPAGTPAADPTAARTSMPLDDFDAPFMIMDEVDAALDNVNVAKLANFIKHQAKGLQIIAVSLKDQFYTEAEALVGVAKDLSAASSKPFCLDLAKYQQVAA
ncbi:hypothetical protein AURANDRAFT_70503 [Aureococcus anophagefferens]|uniref:SMC hinge domain-containing protein n=1 Tax=Aureococcus anophagefferens TaxID=44056 RepID=F0XVB2_AURAN|nr:hypothetical protein AURANDRAFT_70503 [Aureococcus anophagefferens]EGB12562.1 hypothetical protein AURANDRAFT_70503 [Aureococcus anophagefferens]|eukprot:XP_009032234.1 hypothetical protein AURANDRAFT_70503 [Aureococcus anophagefferens]